MLVGVNSVAMYLVASGASRWWLPGLLLLAVGMSFGTERLIPYSADWNLWVLNIRPSPPSCRVRTAHPDQDVGAGLALVIQPGSDRTDSRPPLLGPSRTRFRVGGSGSRIRGECAPMGATMPPESA